MAGRTPLDDPRCVTSWKLIVGAIVTMAIGRIRHPPSLSGAGIVLLSPIAHRRELLTGAAYSCVAGDSLLAIKRLGTLALVGALVFCVTFNGTWPIFATFVIPIACLGTAAIIAACVAPSPSRLKRFLSTRPLVWLQESSYASLPAPHVALRRRPTSRAPLRRPRDGRYDDQRR